MKELAYEIKTQGGVLLLKIALLVLVFLGMYNVFSFSRDIEQSVDATLAPQTGYNLYSVCDTLIDPNAFSEFRQSEKSMASVCDFYNLLNANQALSFASVFDQPLAVTNFKGGPQFRYAYGTEMTDLGVYTEPSGLNVEDIKSVQLNEHAFRFYGISVNTGSAIRWNTIDYTSDAIPVLLGSDYESLYSIGDTLTALYYFKKITLTVSGFLDKHSVIYYKGNPNYSLDSSIVVPYPARLDTTTGHDFAFLGRLAFAMINGDIAAPIDAKSSEVLDALYSISAESGFFDYSLINSPEYLVQLSMTRKLVQENLSLVATIQILVLISIAIVVSCLNQLLSRSRMLKVGLLRTAGLSHATVLNTLLPSMAAAGVTAFGISLIVVGQLPNQSPEALFATSIVFCLVIAIDIAIQRRNVHIRPLALTL